MKRQRYDLSHYSTQAGQVGRLQTLTCIPVVAGDTFSLQVGGELTLSPLRRRIVLDCQLTMAAFWIPYRHIWDDDWIDFIKEGYDETVTLGSDTVSASADYGCYGWKFGQANAFKPVITGYDQIWNRYWRSVTHQDEVVEGTVMSGDRDILYGRQICHLPSMLNSQIQFQDEDAADYEVTVTSGKFDIRDLAKTRAQLRTEIDREYFGRRYNDLMKGQFGSGVNIDADVRPELLGTYRRWFGGYDAEGGDDASLGQLQGKSSTVVQFGLPRRYFAEHGIVHVVGTVRYPFIHHDERHYYGRVNNPSYLELAGDPELLMMEHTRHQAPRDYFNSADTTSMGEEPYGQWWRHHPNILHPLFENADGYPYLTDSNSVEDRVKRVVVQSDAYDDMFITNQYGHWQAYLKIGLMADRIIPGVKHSMYAGAS